MAAIDRWFERNTTDAEKAKLAAIRAPQPLLTARERTHDRVLGEIVEFVSRFVAFPAVEHQHAVALWVVHAWSVQWADTTARLSIQSAEKQSGKTRLLEVLEMLVPAPLQVASISPAAMFRVIADGPVTLLVDEVDAIFAPKSNAEDLRSLLNAGYRKGATVARCVGEGKKMTVQRFPVFAPVVLAGIGTLPDTVQDRSIVIRLKRRAKDEPVAKLRRRLVQPEADRLKAKIETWISASGDMLAAAIPEMPEELPDRAADIWEQLFAIADLVGGPWPKRARAAALKLSMPELSRQRSNGIRLLADVRNVFDERGVDRLCTADLLQALHAIDESNWGETWFTKNKLASKLRPFDVRPKQIWVDSKNERGYDLADFADAFERYLPNLEMTASSARSARTQASTRAAASSSNGSSDPSAGEYVGMSGFEIARHRAAEAHARRITRP